MSKENRSTLTQAVAFAPVAIAADATTFGIEIDTQGYESISFATAVGVVTTGDITPSIWECATTGGTFTEVDSSKLIGSYETLDTTNGINSVGAVTLRFAKIQLISDNSAALLVSSQATLGHPHNAPTA